MCVANKQSGRGSSLWVCLLWSVGAFDVFNVWVWVIVGAAAPCRCLLARWKSLRGVFNERSGRGTPLWVCLLWSVGAFDVVDVWGWVTVGVAAPCW